MQEATADKQQKKQFSPLRKYLNIFSILASKSHTLRSRLALWNALVILLTLTVLGIIVYQTVSYVLIQSLDNRLRDQAAKLQAQTLASSNRPYNTAFFQQLVRGDTINEFATNSIYIKLFDKDTSHLIAFSPYLSQVALPLPHSDFVAAQHSQQVLTSWVDKNGNEVHTLTLGLRDKQQHLVVIAQISQSLQVVKQVQNILFPAIIIHSIIAAFIAYAFIFWLTSYELRPLKILITTMHNLSSQHLQTRLQTGKAVQEIRLLTDTFNRMVERLEASFVLQRNFVTDVSHELRTPLTAIQGLIDILLLDNDLKKDDRRDLKQINAEVKRLSRLVGNLLTTTRAETGTLPQPFSNGVQFVELDLLVVEVARQLRFFNQQCTLEIQDLQQISVPGDVDLLKQLLLNLTENALTHAGQPCTVRLSLTLSHALPPQLASTAHSEQRDWAVLSVCDTGPGIDPDDLPHIFERYYRAKHTNKRSKTGSGLGLSIARLIAEAHFGSITVETEPGKGSCFHVWLPISIPANIDISPSQ